MKSIFDRILVGLNGVVLVTLGVVLLRPEGMLRTAVRDRLVERRVKAYLATSWDSLTKGAPVIAGADSSVEVVVFSDYECPACRSTFAGYDVVSARGKGIGIALRHFPMASYPNARRAAAAAICAGRQGQFRAMNRVLFTTPLDSLGLEWTRAAEAAGVPDERGFLRCMEEPSTNAQIAEDSTLAAYLGINGTPTFVTRAGRFPGARSPDQLLRLANEAHNAK